MYESVLFKGLSKRIPSQAEWDARKEEKSLSLVILHTYMSDIYMSDILHTYMSDELFKKMNFMHALFV